MKRALVLGAGGFIGGHLVKWLKGEGAWVSGVDLKQPEFSPSLADQFILADLRQPNTTEKVIAQGFDEIYQLAADMGGAGYVFSGQNDADIMHNSTLINLNVLNACRQHNVGVIFYSSSACVYPEHNQLNVEAPCTEENSAYPAAPDSEYGWEKLFAERLYLAYQRNYALPIRIARLHNVFGEEGTWRGGREKAPAAICRKMALAKEGGELEIWGDGEQTRSFLYITECLEGIRRLVQSDCSTPVNIGSSEMISINDLVRLIADIAGKKVTLKHVNGPLGVRGRTSDNRLIKKNLGWVPHRPLQEGLEVTYRWVARQIERAESLTPLLD